MPLVLFIISPTKVGRVVLGPLLPGPRLLMRAVALVATVYALMGSATEYQSFVCSSYKAPSSLYNSKCLRFVSEWGIACID